MLHSLTNFLYRPDYLKATLSGSLMFLSSLRGKIRNVSRKDNTGKENAFLLMRIIELISTAAMRLDAWYKSHSEEDTSFLLKDVDLLTRYFKDLVTDRDVIGGSMFGYTELRRADDEIHVSFAYVLTFSLHECLTIF